MDFDIAPGQLRPFGPGKRLGGLARTPIAGLYVSGAGSSLPGGIAATPGLQAARTVPTGPALAT